MMGGGLLWAFDIGSVEEFERRIGGRRRGVDGKWRERGERGGDEEVEFERWVAGMTGRKRGDDGEERRTSAREAKKEEGKRGERYTEVESRAMNEKGKPR